MSLPCSRLVVFGDSLSDVGNVHDLLGHKAVPSPPHAPGRLSNGPLWVERLADRLGLPRPTPSRLGGSGHAYGGARSATGFAPFSRVPNLREQVRRHLEEGSGSPVDPDALHVLRAGANDYRDARWPLSVECAEAINANLVEAVEDLADAAVTRFLVPSEIPWSCGPSLPAEASGTERVRLNGMIAEQNAVLRHRLKELAAERGLRIVQPDVHGLILAILAAPDAHGFAEVIRPALPADPEAQGYLWWDDRAHLTTTAHELIAHLAHRSILAGDPEF